MAVSDGRVIGSSTVGVEQRRSRSQPSAPGGRGHRRMVGVDPAIPPGAGPPPSSSSVIRRCPTRGPAGAGQQRRARRRLDLPARAVPHPRRRWRCRRGATCASRRPVRGSALVAMADRKTPPPTRSALPRPADHPRGPPGVADDRRPAAAPRLCQESDGAVAIVVASAERARDLGSRRRRSRAAAQGSAADQFVMTSYYRDDIGVPEMGVVGRELWRQSGLAPTTSTRRSSTTTSRRTC